MGRMEAIAGREKPLTFTVYDGGKTDEPIPKPDGSLPSGPDWLRDIPYGCRFVCHPKNTAGVWLDQFGIAFIHDKCILLAKTAGMGMELGWVDSRKFSEQYKLVTILPEPDKEAGSNDNKSGPTDGPDNDGHEGSA